MGVCWLSWVAGGSLWNSENIKMYDQLMSVGIPLSNVILQYECFWQGFSKAETQNRILMAYNRGHGTCHSQIFQFTKLVLKLNFHIECEGKECIQDLKLNITNNQQQSRPCGVILNVYSDV